MSIKMYNESDKSGYERFRRIKELGFDDYCYSIYPELAKAYNAVTEKIEEDSMSIIEAKLEDLSVHLPRLKDIAATIEMFLRISIFKKIPEKDKGITEMERKAKLDYEVAEERCIRDKVEGLVKSVETRITVLQSRLKSARDQLARTRT